MFNLDVLFVILRLDNPFLAVLLVRHNEVLGGEGVQQQVLHPLCSPPCNKQEKMIENKLFWHAVLRNRIRIRRIRMFLGILDPDLLAGDMDPDPSIIEQK
jgi:hypothetical protein